VTDVLADPVSTFPVKCHCSGSISTSTAGDPFAGITFLYVDRIAGNHV